MGIREKMRHLLFVDNSIAAAADDAQARKEIRSHVMRGKNQGKSIVRRKKNQQCAKVAQVSKEGVSSATAQREGDEAENNSPSVHEFSSVLHALIGHTFSGVVFARDMVPEARQMIHQFYVLVNDATFPHKYCNPFSGEQLKWIQWMTLGERWFHGTLCLMAACSDFYLERRVPTPAALKHFSFTLQSVNQSLSNTEEAISEDTIKLVLGLIVHDQLRRSTTNWHIHVRGLRNLISLRGGLINFSSRTLILKICRADIDLALDEGISPQFNESIVHFPTRHSSTLTLCKTLPHLKGQRQLRLPSDLTLRPQLHSAAFDVTALSHFLNTSPTHKFSADAFQEILLSLCYRLISLGVFHLAYPGTLPEQAYHLGLVIFMTTFMFQFGRRRLLYHKALAMRTKSFLWDCEKNMPKHREIIVWLVFLLGLSGSEDTSAMEASWPWSMLRQELGDLGIVDWNGVHGLLSQFPFVDAVHNENARVLWIRLSS